MTNATSMRVGSHEMADKSSIKTAMDKWHQLVSLLAPQIIKVANVWTTQGLRVVASCVDKVN